MKPIEPLDLTAIAQGMIEKSIIVRQAWGSEWIPYWDQLTPEEQSGKWERHLVDKSGPGVAIAIACDYCKDAKIIHPRQVDGKPDYTQVVTCPQCYVWTDEERERRLIAAGTPKVRQAETFATFVNIPGAKDAFEACFDLATGSPGYSIVLLYGIHGNGKTHLARAAMSEWLKGHQGQSVKFVRVLDWLVQLRAMMSENKADAEIERVKAVGFMVIDEIGSEGDRSDWRAETIEHIINYRYDEQLPTVLTCNGDVTGLPPAIYSRLSDKTVCRTVLNSSADHRPKMGGK